MNIGILGVLKYYNFFISSMNHLIGTDFNVVHLFVPLGLSFYIFQFIGLLYDSYKGRITTISILDYSVFVTYFPKIIQGPITRYQDFIDELNKNRQYNADLFVRGIYLMTIGFGKKILIADALGKFVNVGFSTNYLTYNSLMSIILILSYTFQIYFDFSGYTDLSRGISYLFNIELPCNFNSPYKALSINDFWKRWHMSLTSFFTRYLYIPLGGNRNGELRTYINTMIVFLVSGLWHGANMTFIVWGFIHGLISCLEKKFKCLEHLNKGLRWIYTFMLINFTWLIFRSESLNQVLVILRNILSFDFSVSDFTLFSPLYLEEITYVLSVLKMSKLDKIMPFVILLICLGLCLCFKNSDEIVENFEPNLMKCFFVIIILSWSLLHFGQKVIFIYEMF